jgi:hypothetical protein
VGLLVVQFVPEDLMLHRCGAPAAPSKTGLLVVRSPVVKELTWREGGCCWAIA